MILQKRMVLSAVMALFGGAAQGAVIELENGDRLNAEVISQSKTDVVLKHAVLGEMLLSSEQVKQIDGVDLAVAEAPAVEAVESGWKKSLGAGFNGSKGNSDTMRIYGVFDASYENEVKRWIIQSTFDSSESNGNKTKNQFYAGVTRDWLIPDSKWFYFASAKYDWDEFKDWDYRLTGLLGGGYQFVKSDKRSILGRFGLAGKQNIGGDESGFTPEAMLGLDIDWALTDRQSFAFTTEFYAGLERLGEYRNITRFAWKMLLEEDWDMSLQLGFDNEYESEVAEGIDKNDFKYRAALVWGL